MIYKTQRLKMYLNIFLKKLKSLLLIDSQSEKGCKLAIFNHKYTFIFGSLDKTRCNPNKFHSTVIFNTATPNFILFMTLTNRKFHTSPGIPYRVRTLCSKSIIFNLNFSDKCIMSHSINNSSPNPGINTFQEHTQN